MPNKSRKQKSKSKIYFKTKTKTKFTGGKKLRRSKLRKKGVGTKHVGGEWSWWPGNWFKKKNSKTANNIKNNWEEITPEDAPQLTNKDNLNKRATLYDSKNFNRNTLPTQPSGTGPYNIDTKYTRFQPVINGVQKDYGYGKENSNGNNGNNLPSNKKPNPRRAPIYEGNDDTPPTTPLIKNPVVVQEPKNQKEALECLKKLNIDSEKLNQITQILE